MIRLYLLLGVVAVMVGLGGWAMLERARGQAAAARAEASEDRARNAEAQLTLERDLARRAAIVASEQAKAATLARQQADEAEDRARVLILELNDEPPPPPGCPAFVFDDAWRERLRREIPIRRPATARPASVGQSGGEPVSRP